MAENKKYYWLKLPKDFFENKEIKKLRQLAGGDTYTIIYLKMLLKSIDSEGKLFYEGIDDTIAEEIALDINESADDVQVTIGYLVKKNLMVVTESEAELIKLPEMVGSESAVAERVRRHRELQKTLHCNTYVTLCNNDVTKCNTEIEKDIDKDIEIDKEKDIELEKDIDKKEKDKKKKRKTDVFQKPSEEEIMEYCNSIGHGEFDAQRFVDYYDANGWKVGKNPMKDWKATVRNWIRNSEDKDSKQSLNSKKEELWF